MKCPTDFDESLHASLIIWKQFPTLKPSKTHDFWSSWKPNISIPEVACRCIFVHWKRWEWSQRRFPWKKHDFLKIMMFDHLKNLVCRSETVLCQTRIGAKHSPFLRYVRYMLGCDSDRGVIFENHEIPNRFRWKLACEFNYLEAISDSETMKNSWFLKSVGT